MFWVRPVLINQWWRGEPDPRFSPSPETQVIHHHPLTSPQPSAMSPFISRLCRLREESCSPAEHPTQLTVMKDVFSIRLNHVSWARVPGMSPASVTIQLFKWVHELASLLTPSLNRAVGLSPPPEAATFHSELLCCQEERTKRTPKNSSAPTDHASVFPLVRSDRRPLVCPAGL